MPIAPARRRRGLWLLVSLHVLAAIPGLVAACGDRRAVLSSGAGPAAGAASDSPTAGSPHDDYVSSLVMDPRYSSVLRAALPGGVFWATDHAASWRPLPALGGAAYAVDVDFGRPFTRCAEYVTDDTVQPLRLIPSDDDGYTWTDLTDTGATVPNGYLRGIWLGLGRSAPSAIYLWGEKGGRAGFWCSTDRGDTWKVLRGTEAGVHKSLADGKTWYRASAGLGSLAAREAFRT